MEANKPRIVAMHVAGMTCMSCVRLVQSVLQNLDSVSDVKVSLDDGLAVFKYSSEDDSALIDTISSGAGKVATFVDTGLAPKSKTGQAEKGLKPSHIQVGLKTQQTPSNENSSHLLVTRMRVGGMTCTSCTKSVEHTFLSVNGVKSAKVNLLGGLTLVTHQPELNDSNVLVNAAVDAGFTAEVYDTKSADNFLTPLQSRPTQFRIDFETETQALNASKMLRTFDAVVSVKTIANSTSTEILLNLGYVKSSVLAQLEKHGEYGNMSLRQTFKDEAEALKRGDIMGGTTRAIEKEANMRFYRFCLALVFFVLILITEWIQNHSDMTSVYFLHWIHFFLSTPVQFISGAGFYRAGFYAIKKGRATMDVLVALSTSTAYFCSVFALFAESTHVQSDVLGRSVMFRVSTMITTMILLGKSIETSVKSKAVAGVTELTALQPSSSTLYDTQCDIECQTTVPVNVLVLGDVVSVGPNDKIPTDGIVIGGYSAVNESMLTGESADVAKCKGDQVYGGTMNQQGSLLIRTTAVGDESFVSQIVSMVNYAQTAYAPIEVTADYISAWFVPVIILLSVIVFIVWFMCGTLGIVPKQWYSDEGIFFFSLLFAIETMVIACPCALGLATPTAVMVANHVGARHGVLFRGGAQAIEAANHVRTVLFDKTGTLTLGSPSVSNSFVSERAMQRNDNAVHLLNELVLLVEFKSKHPLASAICKHINTAAPQPDDSRKDNRKLFKLSSVQETPGRGIEGVVNDGEHHICIGSLSFVFERIVNTDVFTEAEIARIESMQVDDALTVVAACIDGSLACVYGLKDNIRPEAASIIRVLQSLGFDTALVTGDSSMCGYVIARQVGIPEDHVHIGVLPDEKYDVVKQYPGPCFVGDGVNDAVALTGADVGVAIGTGSPVAAESADIILIRPNLWGVVDALDLAKETLKRINFNFIWAMVYNLLSVPLAAGVLFPFVQVRVPPILASGAMALSSTCVIVSSLALKLYSPRNEASQDQLSELSSSSSRDCENAHGDGLIGPEQPLLNRSLGVTMNYSVEGAFKSNS